MHRVQAFAWVAVVLTLACGSGPSPTPQDEPAPSEDQTRAEAPPQPGIAGGPNAIRGAGSTFVYPIVRQWSRRYYQQTEVEIVFEAVGSAAGLERLDQGTVTFAATDIPLPVNELERRGYVQWPIVAGAITPVVNLLLEPGELALDGPALADIYLGNVDHWNSPRLRELNPGVALPNSPITVVQRGDASGTAYNFSDYLAQVSLAWRQRLGVWSSSERPVGVSALGNAGVAELVRSIPNSIGYVNFAYAREAGLVYTDMVDRNGNEVSPAIETFRAAMAGARIAETPDFTIGLVHESAGKAWPILATTYIVVKKPPPDSKATAEALRFFSWCFQNGASDAEELLYVAMPNSVGRMAAARWADDLAPAAKLLSNAD